MLICPSCFNCTSLERSGPCPVFNLLPVSKNPLVMASLCSAAPPPGNAPAQGKDSLTSSPLTLTVQQINALTFQNAPMIQEQDAILMEANRGDFDLEIHLSNGNVILTGPHAPTAAARWRGGRIKLDYPGAINRRIVGMKAIPLHDGGVPLLFRGIKFERQGHVILTLDKQSPVQEQAGAAIEPPMSYPSESFAPHPHLMNANISKPDMWHPQPETGFLAPRVPSFSAHPMMFQSTTTSGDPNHYKFNGKELDAETGLYNYGARYYSPALGRFMSPDWSGKPVPVPYVNLKDPQTLNLYAYVRNNPTSLPDPDGHAIQLSDNEDERKKQLAATQQAVGKWPGNTCMTTRTKMGIITLASTAKGQMVRDPSLAS